MHPDARAHVPVSYLRLCGGLARDAQAARNAGRRLRRIYRLGSSGAATRRSGFEVRPTQSHCSTTDDIGVAMDFIEVNNAVLGAERAALDSFGHTASTEARLCDEASTALLCALQLSPKGRMGVHQDMRTGALCGDVEGLFLAAHYVL